MLPARVRSVMVRAMMVTEGMTRRVMVIARKRGLGQSRQRDGKNAGSHELLHCCDV